MFFFFHKKENGAIKKSDRHILSNIEINTIWHVFESFLCAVPFCVSLIQCAYIHKICWREFLLRHDMSLKEVGTILLHGRFMFIRCRHIDEEFFVLSFFSFHCQKSLAVLFDNTVSTNTKCTVVLREKKRKTQTNKLWDRVCQWQSTKLMLSFHEILSIWMKKMVG